MTEWDGWNRKLRFSFVALQAACNATSIFRR